MGSSIYSITDAYSMQPIVLRVGGLDDAGRTIAKIVVEDVRFNGDPFPYCVGYDAYYKKLFEYRKETVNIHYT